MKKRMFSMLLVTSMLLTALPVTAAGPDFTDSSEFCGTYETPVEVDFEAGEITLFSDEDAEIAFSPEMADTGALATEEATVIKIGEVALADTEAYSEGKIAYNAEENILTLNGVELNAPIISTGALNIVLAEGTENSIDGVAYNQNKGFSEKVGVLEAKGAVRITGNGTLKLKGNCYAIRTANHFSRGEKIEISSVGKMIITTEGIDAGAMKYNFCASSGIEITDSDVEIYGTNGAPGLGIAGSISVIDSIFEAASTDTYAIYNGTQRENQALFMSTGEAGKRHTVVTLSSENTSESLNYVMNYDKNLKIDNATVKATNSGGGGFQISRGIEITGANANLTVECKECALYGAGITIDKGAVVNLTSDYTEVGLGILHVAGRSASEYKNLLIQDGAKVNVICTNEQGTLIVSNNAIEIGGESTEVTTKGGGYAAIYVEDAGITIRNGAHVESDEVERGIFNWHGNVSVEGASVTTSNVKYGIYTYEGTTSIADGSDVIVDSASKNAVYSPNGFAASESVIEADSQEQAIIADTIALNDPNCLLTLGDGKDTNIHYYSKDDAPEEWNANKYVKIQPAHVITVTGGTAALNGDEVTCAAEGMTLTVTSGAAPEGMEFKGWKITAGEVTLADSSSPQTTFTMPAEAVSIAAEYDDVYTVTVIDGTAENTNGQQITAAKAGEIVTIRANRASGYKYFKKWTAVSGGVSFASETSNVTTFTMPTEAVTVKATYGTYVPPITTPSPTPSPTPEPIPENFPENSKREPDGSITTPNGTNVKEDGTITLPDGTVLEPDKDGKKPTIDKDNNVTDINGTVIDKEGTITLPGTEVETTEDDTKVEKGDGEKFPVYHPETGNVTTEDGNKVTLPGGIVIIPPTGSSVSKEGVITEPDGTVIKPDGTVYNTDGSIVSGNGIYLRPATPMLLNAEIYATANQVKATLSGECAGAEGYDYVISRNINCIKDKDYLQVSKNILLTNADFRYIPEGTYYVYCHAWIRGENGKKVFSKWSNYQMVTVTATTPQVPEIKDVNVKGSTVTVTYTNCKDADGYDIVLGSALKKVYGEYRPVEYGNLVKKVKGQNTVTVTFRNVKRGRYFVGLHAWNRTSEDGKKVFSPWSKAVRIKVR